MFNAKSVREKSFSNPIDNANPVFPALHQTPSNLNIQDIQLNKAMDYIADRCGKRESNALNINESAPKYNGYDSLVNKLSVKAKVGGLKLAQDATAKADHYSSSDLLWAASKNDTELLKNILTQYDVDINVRGKFGETPLHVAAIVGAWEAAEVLLQFGADTNLLAYKDYDHAGFSALELAILEGNSNVVASFYLNGKADIYTEKELFEYAIENNFAEVVEVMIDNGVHTLYNEEDLEDFAWGRLIELTDLSENIQNPSDYHTLEAMIATLMPLAGLAGTVVGADPYIDFEIPPMSVLLEIYAENLSDSYVHHLLMDTAQQLDAIDGNKAPFLMAKALFHIVPVEGLFKIDYSSSDGFNTKKSFIEGEGFYHMYTVPLIHAGVNEYINSGHILNASQAQAFDGALDSLSLSASLAGKNGLSDTSQTYHEAFNAGQSILLPSGWSGHAVDIVANKDLGVLIIANNGMRFDDLDSGVTIFSMNNADNLTPELIHDILVNEDQTNLELRLAAKLGLVELGSIVEPDQFTGNCAWQSQESALEGLLFLNLLEQGYSFDEAMDLAQGYYHDWDSFQTTAFVQGYFNDDPRIDEPSVAALIKTQAYLLGTDDLNVVKADPTGAILVDAFENMSPYSASVIKLDYDPYQIDIEDLKAQLAALDIDFDSYIQTLEDNGVDTSFIKMPAETLSLDQVIESPEQCIIGEALEQNLVLQPSVPMHYELDQVDMPAFG